MPEFVVMRFSHDSRDLEYHLGEIEEGRAARTLCGAERTGRLDAPDAIIRGKVLATGCSLCSMIATEQNLPFPHRYLEEIDEKIFLSFLAARRVLPEMAIQLYEQARQRRIDNLEDPDVFIEQNKRCGKWRSAQRSRKRQ